MNSNHIIFYSTPNGKIKFEVIFEEESFWLTQKAMATLFGVEVPGIRKHLSIIYETSELQKEATISILETAQQEGRNICLNSLVIFMVGTKYFGALHLLYYFSNAFLQISCGSAAFHLEHKVQGAITI